MGLISKLKSMFSKNIDCSSELNDAPVHFFTTSGRKVNLGTSIVVKEGYCAVLVCKDKVTDVLYEGKHKIDNSTIPQTFKLLKLYKIDENGKSKTSFKCDFYFVNMRFMYNFPFSSDIPFRRRKDPAGNIEAYCEGAVTLKIDTPIKLINYLLIDHAYIRDAKAQKEIGLEIGNMVNKKLEKIKLTFEQILTSGKYVNEFINADITTSMDFMGASVSNIVVNAINMSSRLQKKMQLSNALPPEASQKDKVSMEKPVAVEVGGKVEGISMNINEEIMLQGFDNNREFNESMFKDVVQKDSNSLKQCEVCGEMIKSTAKYCEFCGSKQDNF